MLGGMGGSAGAPPMGPGATGPGAPGSPGLGATAQFQSEMAPGSGEEEALKNASIQLGIALKAMYLRSAKASKLVLGAMRDIQSAREELQKVATAPMQPSPGLGAESPMGGMPPMGGMMGGM